MDGRDIKLPQNTLYNKSLYFFCIYLLQCSSFPSPSTSFFPFFVNKMAAADRGTSAYMPPQLYSLPTTHPSVTYNPSTTPYTSTSQPPMDQADIRVCKGGNWNLGRRNNAREEPSHPPTLSPICPPLTSSHPCRIQWSFVSRWEQNGVSPVCCECSAATQHSSVEHSSVEYSSVKHSLKTSAADSLAQ